MSTGIVFDELSVKVIVRPILFTRKQNIPYCYGAAHLGLVSAFHSSSEIFSFSPRILSFTPMGSGDAILCADHPILGQAVIVLHLDYPNCYESQDAFSSGHVERTSLPHRLDVFLGVMDQQLPPCKSSHYVQETWNSKGRIKMEIMR